MNIEDLLNKINKREFWSRYAPEWSGSDANIKCPISHFSDRHPNGDKNKSFKIFQDYSFKCFGSSCGIVGDVINFYAAYNRTTNSQAIIELAKDYVIQKDKEVENYKKYEIDYANKSLLKDDHTLNLLLNQRGITSSIIKKYQLGFEKDRLYTPIKKGGVILNLNRHDIFKKKRIDGEAPSLFEPGKRIHPFPYNNIEKNKIVLCAGIPDALFLLSVLEGTDYNPLTFGSEGVIPQPYIRFFKDKEIYIVFDNDKGGEKGIRIISERLFDLSESLKKIEFPSKYNDIGNFLIDIQPLNRRDEILTRIDSACHIEKVETDNSKEKAIEVNFNQLENREFFNKRIKTNITVIGMDPHPFIYPSKISIKCNPIKKQSCTNCKVHNFGGFVEHNTDSKDIIRFVDIGDTKRRGVIRDVSPLNPKCRSDSMSIISNEESPVYEVSFTETIGSNSCNKSIKTGFMVNYSPKYNTTYEVYGYPVKIPKNQKITFVFDKVVPHANELDNFKFSNKVKQSIDLIFDKKQSVEERINRFTNNLMDNVVKMWNREDVIIACNMTIFSALQFNFNKRLIRGWVELYLLGDSGTAKSITVKALMDHYMIGHTITGEAVSSAGLIGAMSKVGIGTRHLVWGALPSSDRKMVFMDEIHDADPTIIKNLSSLRSSGRAIKTVEQGTRETEARVRIIFAANPKKKFISDEVFPINLIKEVFSGQEDRARLDFVLMLGLDEVSTETINKVDNSKGVLEFDSLLCNELVTWVWSRSPEQVVFNYGVTEYILETSMKMIKKYSERDIGIIHKSRYSEKLARLSVAVAAMVFSHEEFRDIIVKKEHVDYAITFQNRIYQKSSCNYENLAGFLSPANTEKGGDDIIQILKNYTGRVTLFLNDYYAKKDFEAICENNSMQGEILFSKLLNGMFIEKTKSGYRKTGRLTALLKSAQEKGEF